MTVVLWLALLFVLYTYAGYPLLCHVRARRWPRPVRPAPAGEAAHVSVVIAAYRERRTIAAKLRTLAAQDHPADRLEVIIVCDGSDDGTADEARAAGERFMPGRVRVLELPRGGKPAALNAGVAAARGDVLVFTDARQELNEGAISALCRDLRDPEVGVVSGELVLAGAAGSGAYWRYEAWIRKNEGRAGSVVGVSGALYAMARRRYVPMPVETILDDLFEPMAVRLREPRLRVVFEPEARALDTAAEHGREFSRKARTLAGNYQLLLLVPALLSPWRNPSWFNFVSHKLCRLLVPYALGLLLVCSAAAGAAGSGFWGLLFAGQVMCYGLAALVLVPGLGRLAPVKLCSTFVVLNAAAVVGLWRVLRHGLRQRWT